MAVKVIPLKCPECAGILSGFENDRIFFCANCQSGWDFSSEIYKPLRVSYARAKKIPSQYQMLFYLPFYFYQVVLEMTLDREVSDTVARIIKDLNYIYVAGFQLLRENYFGDLGLIYTESRLALEEDKERNSQAWQRIGSATRGLDDVEPYLKHYPLLIVDKRQDITGMELRVRKSFDRIWAVPFFDLGKQIQDGILGRTFSSYALDTIDEFRKIRY